MIKPNLGYAQALFELSLENKVLDEFLNESKILLKIFKSNPKLIAIMNNYQISKDEKKELINNIFDKHIHPLFLNGLKLMIDHSRFSNLDKTLKELITLINESIGVKEGIVYSVEQLIQETIDKLENKLSKTINKKVQLINHVDKQLIGGLKVVIDNKVYDNTLLTQLQNLKSEIMKGK